MSDDSPAGPRRRGPQPQVLDEGELARLARIRVEANDARGKLMETGPGDPLGSLVWLATIADPASDTDRIGVAMDLARQAGYTWRQIAQALDEGGTAEDGRRVMDRRRSWAM